MVLSTIQGFYTEIIPRILTGFCMIDNAKKYIKYGD